MTTRDAFGKFKSYLELPDQKFSQASAAQQEVREGLAEHLDIYDSFLSGSYARYTKIEPLKDIDVILVRNTGPVGLSTTGNGITANTAINEVATAVQKAFSVATVVIQARSVNVTFPNLTFGFDLVPAWQRSPDGYWIPDRDTNSWIASSPKYHDELMTAANKSTAGVLKPVVKMLKHWNAKNLQLLRSFHVELMCKDILLEDSSGGFPFCVWRCFVGLTTKVGLVYMDPTYGETRVDKPLTPDHLEKLKATLQYDAEQARQALWDEHNGDHPEAIAKWKKIFVSGF